MGNQIETDTGDEMEIGIKDKFIGIGVFQD